MPNYIYSQKTICSKYVREISKKATTDGIKREFSVLGVREQKMYEWGKLVNFQNYFIFQHNIPLLCIRTQKHLIQIQSLTSELMPKLIKKPKEYKKIHYQTRLKIIKLYFDEAQSMKDIGALLGLGPSTVRMILKRYREDGVIFQRKQEIQQRIQNEKVKNEKAETRNQNSEIVKSIKIESQNSKQFMEQAYRLQYYHYLNYLNYCHMMSSLQAQNHPHI